MPSTALITIELLVVLSAKIDSFPFKKSKMFVFDV